MPIRFRKSVKVAPGVRLNLSGKGVSTSVGAGGMKYNSKKVGSNCLYYVFIWPLVLIFQFYGLLAKGVIWLFKQAIATPQSRRISLIALGAMSVIGVGSAAISAITGTENPTKSQPVLDQQSIQDTAVANAWLSYTQTMQAMPTNTSLPTLTLAPTDTALPTETPTLIVYPTATLIVFPTATAFIFPTFTSAPAADVCPCGGDVLNCGDFGSWSSAQACFTYCVSQGVGDIHGLDGNNDGSACDSLR